MTKQPTVHETVKRIKIASPCQARWEDMVGDERSRFCGRCEKRVYNFSQMNADEISRLIQEKKGAVCARFYQRSDGTMLIGNCPVGARMIFHRLTIVLGCLFALFTISASAAFGISRPQRTSHVRQRFDEALWKVKGWFGIQRPPVLMGNICIPMPAQPQPFTNPPSAK